MFELAQSDYDILHSIENIVDGLLQCMASIRKCYVPFRCSQPFDYQNREQSCHWSRRGAPITNLALMKLTQGKDVSGAYMTKCPDGKTLRSTTTIIRKSSTESHWFVMYQHQPRCAIPRGDAFTVPCLLPALRKTSNHA